MRARVPILALTALTGLALTACSASPSSGNPQSAARAVETAVNQEVDNYLATPDEAAAIAGLLSAGPQATSLRDSITEAANAAVEDLPGVTATVKDLPGDIATAVPLAFEVTSAGSPPWCVALDLPTWSDLPSRMFDDSTTASPDALELYRAAAGDCTAVLKLHRDAVDDQRAKAYRTVAIADGNALAREITMLLADATHMGTTPANITTWATYDPQTETLTLTPGEGAVGVGTTVTMLLTSGTTITSSGMTGGPVGATGPQWCIAVDNNGQVAVFTEAGLQAGKNSCTVDGTAQ